MKTTENNQEIMNFALSPLTQLLILLGFLKPQPIPIKKDNDNDKR